MVVKFPGVFWLCELALNGLGTVDVQELITHFEMLLEIRFEKCAYYNGGKEIRACLLCKHYVQLWPSLTYGYYENEVTLREQNLLLKYWQPLEMLKYFEERFRSFHTFHIRSVGQRAVKILAIKFGGLKKNCHPVSVKLHLCSPGLTPTGFKSLLKFDEWQLCSPLS